MMTPICILETKSLICEKELADLLSSGTAMNQAKQYTLPFGAIICIIRGHMPPAVAKHANSENFSELGRWRQ